MHVPAELVIFLLSSNSALPPSPKTLRDFLLSGAPGGLAQWLRELAGQCICLRGRDWSVGSRRAAGGFGWGGRCCGGGSGVLECGCRLRWGEWNLTGSHWFGLGGWLWCFCRSQFDRLYRLFGRFLFWKRGFWKRTPLLYNTLQLLEIPQMELCQKH